VAPILRPVWLWAGPAGLGRSCPPDRRWCARRCQTLEPSRLLQEPATHASPHRGFMRRQAAGCHEAQQPRACQRPACLMHRLQGHVVLVIPAGTGSNSLVREGQEHPVVCRTHRGKWWRQAKRVGQRNSGQQGGISQVASDPRGEGSGCLDRHFPGRCLRRGPGPASSNIRRSSSHQLSDFRPR